MQEPEHPSKGRDFGLSGGDIGVIAIALVFGLCGIYLMLGPSPFGDAFVRMKHQREQQPTEVTVGITPDGKPPQPER